MATSATRTAFPAARILDEIAEALELFQESSHVVITVANGDAPVDRREIRVDKLDIGKTAHVLRRAVDREEAL